MRFQYQEERECSLIGDVSLELGRHKKKTEFLGEFGEHVVQARFFI